MTTIVQTVGLHGSEAFIGQIEGANSMTKAMAAGIARDSSDTEDEVQIVGRQIWRIVPYVTKYWQRAIGGLIANMGARAFDLIPLGQKREHPYLRLNRL